MVVGPAGDDVPKDFPTYPGGEFSWTEERSPAGRSRLVGIYDVDASYATVRDFYVATTEFGDRYKSTEVEQANTVTCVFFRDSVEGANGQVFVLAPSWSTKATRVVVYLRLSGTVMLLKEYRPGVLGKLAMAFDIATAPFHLARLLLFHSRS